MAFSSTGAGIAEEVISEHSAGEESEEGKGQGRMLHAETCAGVCHTVLKSLNASESFPEKL